MERRKIIYHIIVSKKYDRMENKKMYYNFKKVTLIYSTNKEIMKKIGRKLGFSLEKNQFVPIDTPLMSADLAYGTGQMMFTTENGKSLCISAISSTWRKDACSVITENNIYVFEVLD